MPSRPANWTLKTSMKRTLAIVGVVFGILALLVALSAGGLREHPLWRVFPPRIDAIAFLPLENLSQDPAQQYLADGISATLILDAQQIGALRAVGGKRTLPYKKAPKPLSEIARELGVDAVV